jgi:RNA polymerase-binding transcription factor DksA
MATSKKKATKVVKKVTAKKAVKGKKVVSTLKKALPKKVALKKTIAKKPSLKKAVVTKKVKLAKKIAKPNIKSVPAKKSAKPVQKIAVPKKLANTMKKPADKKVVPGTKKVLMPSNKTVSSSAKIETVHKTLPKKQVDKVVEKTPVVNINDHKKELKKALKKTKETDVKKPEKPFVMPKTNTEKARKYEPQFIKSVLDQAPEENSGPSMRYSDSELNEFRDLISRKLETAKKELGYLQGLITRKDEMGGDDTDNRYMTMEDGSLSMEREQLSQMASRQITFIDHLEKAMMRIENKTYGICRVTGKLIDKARLRAVPHATLSIEAKMGIAK